MPEKRFLVPVIALAVLSIALTGCIGVLEDSTDEAEANRSADFDNRSSDPTPPSNSTIPGPGERDDNASRNHTDEGAPEPMVVTEPLAITGEEKAFEPSIEVGPEGTVYVTAAPTERPGEGTRLSSFLWFSQDRGETWTQMPSPGQVHQRFPGLEGDLAIDGEGRLYFVDTGLADTFLHRWGSGPEWELSRPLATSTPFDDRPWVAAGGDGVVYLLVQAGASDPPPAPENLREGQTSDGNQWLYVSQDGGRTWTLGRAIADEEWCQMATPETNASTLLVACHGWNYGGQPGRVLRSIDAGKTFEEVHRVELSKGAVPMTPGVAIDEAQNMYVAFLDDEVEDQTEGRIQLGTTERWTGNASGRILYASSTNGGDGWTDRSLRPFPGRYANLHASAGRNGTLALSFYATRDLSPGEDTEWYPYLAVTANATATDPSWRTIRLTDASVRTGHVPPWDFFQNAIGPDNRVHVAFQRDIPYDQMRDGVAPGVSADVMYTRQVAGPNLGE